MDRVAPGAGPGRRRLVAVAVTPAALDHLVVIAPDLGAAIDELERRLGVRAAPGGRHPAWGTRNALMSLGPDAYLEILAPDDEASRPEPRPLGLDALEGTRLGTWAVRVPDLGAAIRRSSTLGIELGPVHAGRRRRADGVELAWQATDLRAPRLDGAVPFLIDWGATPHPSSSAPAGVTMRALRVEHPDPERVRTALTALGIAVPVAGAPTAALIATLRTPRGEVELR